jgi:hypothetical protein
LVWSVRRGRELSQRARYGCSGSPVDRPSILGVQTVVSLYGAFLVKGPLFNLVGSFPRPDHTIEWGRMAPLAGSEPSRWSHPFG